VGVRRGAGMREGMGKKVWPGGNPMRHTPKMFDPRAPWVTIVGIAADVRARGFQHDAPMTMYFPYSQSGRSAYTQPRRMTVVLRAERDAAAAAGPPAPPPRRGVPPTGRVAA